MCGLPVAIQEFVVYRDPTGCLTAFCFSPFEVRDDSNPSGDGLSHLNRIKLGRAATAGIRAKVSRQGMITTILIFKVNALALLRTIGGSITVLVGFSLHLYFPAS